MAIINGTTSNDTLSGTAGDDTLNGFEGNDLFLAGSTGGTDVINGGAGRDSIEFKNRATSAIVVDFAAGTITGGSSGTISFTSIERILTGDFNDTLIGNAAGQTLTGQGGSDTISGAGGVDTLWGGTAADSFVFRETGTANADRISDFASGSDKIVLDASVMSALGASGNFAAGDARFVANSAGTAQDASDRIIYETDTRQIWYDADGNGAAATRQLIATLQVGATLVAGDIVVQGGSGGGSGTITGTEGDDSLTGTSGNDTINGLGGDDTLSGLDGDDRLDGGTGNDWLFGYLGADLIIGGEGNDTLRGDAYDEEGESRTESFVDTMQGGLGDDVFYVDSTSHVMSDDGGVDTVVALEVDWTLGAGFENLILHNDLSESSLTGIGNELDNVISMSYAGGHLEGRAGNDTLLGGGADTGNHLLGGDGDDSLVGSGGHTLLDGGAGQDILRTGAFRDHGESTAFAFSAAPGAANADRIIGFVPDADTIQLDGSVFTNVGFTGEFSAGDARFHSGAGASAGHDADDRIIYDTSTGNLWHDADGNGAGAAQLIATLEGAPGLAATNIEIVNAPGLLIQGTEGNDSLVGTGSQDTINGLGGNDTIDGGREADSMTGGPGNDVFFVDHAGDVVIEQQGGGIDEVSTGLFFSYTLPDWVENLTLTAQGSQEGHGNALDNVLTATGIGQALHGSDGNDTLLGGSDGATWLFGERGNDSLVGGASMDILFGGDGDDTISGGDGNDEIWMSFFSGQGETGLGTDIIDGGAGRDRMIFSSDAFNGQGDHGAVVVDLASGTYRTDVGSGTISNIEVVTGGSAGDQLTGGAQADLLVGNGGNDTLDGGAGVDTLSGGIGADTFVFAEAPGVGTADVIAEGQFFFFQTGIDTLRLDAAAMPGLGISGRFASGDERFHIGTAAAEADDRVIYNSSNGQLFYDGDGSGAGAAALIATINSAPAVAASDIEVVNGTAPSGNVINGTAGADTLSGTAGDDTIDGMAGNDVLRGFEGADSLRGGAGNDTLWGFWELSEFESDFAADTLEGGLGDDEYNVNDDGDVILADPGGIDTVVAWNADWTLDAGLENLELESLIGNGTGNELGNRIAGAYEGGMLVGLAGSDTLIARGSENGTRLDGGAGVDTLVGATGVDAYLFTVAPGAANADEIAAFDSGEDRIVLDGAVHTSSGPSGTFAAGDARFWSSGTGTAHDADDRVIYQTGTGELWYDADGNGAGARQLIATLEGAPTAAATDIEVINGSAGGQLINGTSGNDTLTGTAGDDTINGLGGNDLFVAGSTGGDDVVDGGAGRDSIEFKERATSAITVDFVAGTITGGSSGTISFTNLERILTGNFNDTLTGNGASQTLTGQGGADTIWGAGGTDTLWGGTGTDAFVFREMGTPNADRISDFASGTDKLHLDDAAFSAIGAMGNFAASDARFKTNSSGTATETNDRVVFNTSTGQLYYDADGSGSGAAPQLIATVQAGASVAAADIMVI